jgi:hypothetical protein
VVPIADTGVCINNRRQTAHPTRACLHFAPTEISRLGNNVFIGHAAEGHTQSACGLGQRGHSAAEASFSALGGRAFGTREAAVADLERRLLSAPCL